MRVLICGDRHWTNEDLIEAHVLNVLSLLDEKDNKEELVIIHGGAKGADSIAGKIAEKYDLKVEEYDAEWDRYGRGAGPIRNQRMLDEGKPDIVLAFHNDIEKSKGTKDMINRAKKANVRVVLISEEGVMVIKNV